MSNSTERPEAMAFMESVLDLARRAGVRAEVYWSSARSLPVSFESGQLKRVDATHSQAWALRVLREGRVGLSSTTVAADAPGLVERALALASYGPPAEFEFPTAAPLEGAWWDERVAAVSADTLIDWGKSFIGELGEAEPEALAHANMERREETVRIINTSGLDAGYRKTVIEANFLAQITEEGNFLQVAAWDASTHLGLNLGGLRGQVLEDLRRARHNVSLPGGEYPVVIGPRAVRDLLGPILACVDGRAVRRGISPWRDKLGQPLLHSSFTLLDDGRLPGGPASGACDDEGVPTRRTAILEKGVLGSFLLDLESAAALGSEPTGNAVRPELADGMPQPHPTNLLLAPGETPVADLLASIKDGMLVEDFMGAWSGNLYAGAVTGNVSLGFRLRDGQRVGRVKDCMLSVNVFNVLRDALGGISRETVRLGSATFPYVLLERATVSTRA